MVSPLLSFNNTDPKVVEPLQPKLLLTTVGTPADENIINVALYETMSWINGAQIWKLVCGLFYVDCECFFIYFTVYELRILSIT